MIEPEHLGVDHRRDRQLFLVDAPSPTELRSLLPKERPFVALVAWDAAHATVDAIGELAEGLLDAGCVYVCCWGPGCERVHDIIDEVAVDRDPDGPTIMTTWHAEERLEDALRFMLFSTEPVADLGGRCDAAVAVAVASPMWTSALRRAMVDTRAFEASASDTEEEHRDSASNGIHS